MSSTDALRDEVAALTKRVARLERAAEKATVPVSPPQNETSEAETFWALNGLRERVAQGGEAGQVMMVGTLTLPDGSPVEWQQAASQDGLLEAPWADAAGAFSALGHPVRLELLRHLLNGVRTTSELAALDGMGTTGQLHHHLRDLVAAGWVKQISRGNYAVPATRIVPLLVMLTGVMP